ncbi:hypothetical protein PsYK624_043860 [Phanerochaete sordida]|uniref:Uncharacterized protein n=1 Tax=Phanerochaete sordida TaxID=48140 RepID=A0A9P3LBP5_9APHY|nr:hypothetical protein PsYK624_043860 [Phanerochaete sordida]
MPEIIVAYRSADAQWWLRFATFEPMFTLAHGSTGCPTNWPVIGITRGIFSSRPKHQSAFIARPQASGR